MSPRLAGPEDAATLAAIHAEAFEAPWREADIAALLDQPEVFGLIDDQGFILMRRAAGEAEVLTLAVAPPARRHGLARSLLADALARVAADAAEAAFLEVAEDNHAAIGLYRQAGFRQVGRRRGYYTRANQGSVDALVLRRDLNSPSL